MTLSTFNKVFPQGREDIPRPASFTLDQRAALMHLNGAAFTDEVCVSIARYITSSEGLLKTLPIAVSAYMDQRLKDLAIARYEYKRCGENLRAIDISIDIVKNVQNLMNK